MPSVQGGFLENAAFPPWGASDLESWHLHEHRYVASSTAHLSCLPAMQGPKSFDPRKVFLVSGFDFRHLLRTRPLRLYGPASLGLYARQPARCTLAQIRFNSGRVFQKDTSASLMPRFSQRYGVYARYSTRLVYLSSTMPSAVSVLLQRAAAVRKKATRPTRSPKARNDGEEACWSSFRARWPL